MTEVRQGPTPHVRFREVGVDCTTKGVKTRMKISRASQTRRKLWRTSEVQIRCVIRSKDERCTTHRDGCWTEELGKYGHKSRTYLRGEGECRVRGKSKSKRYCFTEKSVEKEHWKLHRVSCCGMSQCYELKSYVQHWWLQSVRVLCESASFRFRL